MVNRIFRSLNVGFRIIRNNRVTAVRVTRTTWKIATGDIKLDTTPLLKGVGDMRETDHNFNDFSQFKVLNVI